MIAGILALQGDFAAHADILGSISVGSRYIRRPDDLDGIDGLVMPGGESTTMSILMESVGLFEPLRRLIIDGMPVLATCAGMIMLSAEIADGRDDQISFKMLDVSIKRNGYGRQLQSFEKDIWISGIGPAPFHGVFIRAPRVIAAGPRVEVLARVEGDIAMCREGTVLACTFHPELTADRRVHSLFVEMMRDGSRQTVERKVR
ncbi:MAG: pyridoxal 5'-phosphate synthase glutaminase subunit PdxT [Actinobacteria bacterium]|nr:pyridoxal 5'-phosphate synthase glutaminase subunit PdxT [Actinomycetota bacterium]MCL5445845.1 pyridoxal 5'-phosphate synthase glutaminase subunit PdxT [Actinomycetota bacterium]